MGQDIFLPDMWLVNLIFPKFSSSDTKHFISYLQHFLCETAEDLSNHLHGLTAHLFKNRQKTDWPMNFFSD
jgi:hypothetical protein